jgi:hypothetical protein
MVYDQNYHNCPSLVSQIKAKDPQFCSCHMKCFGDVANMSKIEKVF